MLLHDGFHWASSVSLTSERTGNADLGSLPRPVNSGCYGVGALKGALSQALLVILVHPQIWDPLLLYEKENALSFLHPIWEGGGVSLQKLPVSQSVPEVKRTLSTPACSPFLARAYATPVLAPTALGRLEPFSTPPSGLASGLCQVRQIRLFPSQTRPPWSLPTSCSHQVLCLCMSKLLGWTEFKSFSQKNYNSHRKVGRSCIPGYRGRCGPPAP